MFSLIFNVASLTISFAFPLVSTFKSLKTNDIALIKPWLIYWLVFGSLTITEFQLYNVVLKFLPFYSILKLYLSIWLILPNTKGYEFIYTNYIAYYLSRYESQIDSNVNKLTSKHPLDFIISLLKNWNVLSSDQNTSTSSSNTSIFDKFTNSFISSTPQSPQNLVESLFGVFQAVSTTKTAPTLSPTTTSNATTTNDDYDFVGKDEYEDLDETNESKPLVSDDEGLVKQKGSNGWFNWWSNGYAPIDQAKKDI